MKTKAVAAYRRQQRGTGKMTTFARGSASATTMTVALDVKLAIEGDNALTIDELCTFLEAELAKMRKWKQRNYPTERAIVEVFESPTDTAAINRALAILSAALKEDLRKSEPEGNALTPALAAQLMDECSKKLSHKSPARRSVTAHWANNTPMTKAQRKMIA